MLNPIVSRDAWLTARLALLEEEKHLTRQSDALARKRQELPWVRLDKAYRFETADGRARFHPVEYRGPAESPDPDYPFFLTTGRLLGHYQSGTQTRRVPELAEAQPDPFVEMHPETARGIGVREGAMVRLTTRRGRMSLKVRLSPDIRMDTLFVPFHWSGAGAANLLTNTALDPIARIPEFKVCAVRAEPDDNPPEVS